MSGADDCMCLSLLLNNLLSLALFIIKIVLIVLMFEHKYEFSHNGYLIILVTSFIELIFIIFSILRHVSLCMVPCCGEQDDDSLSNEIMPRYKVWTYVVFYIAIFSLEIIYELNLAFNKLIPKVLVEIMVTNIIMGIVSCILLLITTIVYSLAIFQVLEKKHQYCCCKTSVCWV